MSTDSVNGESYTKKDETWQLAIRDSEAEIEACQKKIGKLRKSIIFFKKQSEMGVPFPVKISPRHEETS